MTVEPSCPHAPTVRVSSHVDLAGADGPTASAYCCDREKCRKKITFWVQGLTGRTAVVVALPRPITIGARRG